ncbi:uncharacterized protein LOC130629539 [Hydractinia symbiolongicarpus]|uniref:uncharacterized protein LOC130629539 n=1 Tax=Hydractinia symbiolongicarpus TaxID=13093 RepID=UPI0025512D59|nr:uncharacterized protein LOC130629539 [Hydractinia symbiolongicarpus]
MRAEVIRSTQSISYRNKDVRFNNFLAMFPHQSITKEYFNRKAGELNAFVRKFKWMGEKRCKYLEEFSREKWLKLDSEKQKYHTTHECVGCSSLKADINTFPISTTHRRKKPNPLKTPFADITNTPDTPINIILEIPHTKNDISYMKGAAEFVFDSVNDKWDKIFDTPFTKILTKGKSANVAEVKTNCEKKRELRQKNTKIKKCLEKKCFGQGKVMDTILGIRQSKSTYKKSRSIQYLENKEKAVERMIGRKQSLQSQTDDTPMKKKRHSPDTNKINFDRNALLEEVKHMEDGSKVVTNIIFCKQYLQYSLTHG